MDSLPALLSRFALGLSVCGIGWAAEPLPLVDISGDEGRQVVIAEGTPEFYQGHPTTVLLPDGKTMYAVWTLGHGGFCGPMKRSDDGGKTWSELLPVPENWRTVKNCPVLYRLTDPKGTARLFVFAGQGPDRMMQSAHSMDDGKTWTPMSSVGLECVMPFCTITPVEGGKKLIGLTNIRRPGETKDKKSNVVAQSESTDGGLTWAPWRVLVDLGDLKPCEPEVVRSPDGRQLLCLMRENVRTEPAHYITSENEGETWSAVKDLPRGLHGDRHKAVYAADGRLVVCFRDMMAGSSTRGHFVAWVGQYDDIPSGREGAYRVKLLHNYSGTDSGYPGLEALPDGTLVATTYLKHQAGEKKHSVVSVRFNLQETDKAKRATHAAAGSPTSQSRSGVEPQEIVNQRKAQAAAVAVSPLTKEMPSKSPPKPDSEPIFLAKDVDAKAVDGKSYDLAVVGATAGGVACAVRAAREGCTVLLVQHNRHIGGMLSNGLMQWDALYGGLRSPLFSELLSNIEKHYIETFGKDSRDHQIMRYTHEHYPVGWVEPHVMERECHRLVAAEKNITLLLEHYPAAVERAGVLIEAVTLRKYGTNQDVRVKAATFADGTYEGDLFALAKVPYRAGREARDEYGEPHAGKVFVNINHTTPQSVIEQGLNIYAYNSRQGTVDPTSPFTADRAVQAYNYRFCVTRDPANRIMLTEPPPGYDREEFVNYDRKAIPTNLGPNFKSHMNSPILPGENHDYPEASWEERERIIERHKNFALGLMWFLQNDETVPAKKKAEYRQWGLPKDEFADNGHIPYEMYVREARRIAGRHVITEQDGMLAKTYGRTPVQPDSIATTEWYMDSHSCTMESRPGYRYEGKLILTEESRPAQIPYRSLLPQGVDNLLVPVCLSCTHIAWGAIRLEPVWMQTGEAAGFAAALAKQKGVNAGKLDAELVLRTLVERRQMVSFFNDLKVDAEDARIPAAQYFGTKGFFHDYNARLDEPVRAATLAVWKKAMADLQAGALNPRDVAEAVAKAEAEATAVPEVGKKRGDVLLELYRSK